MGHSSYGNKADNMRTLWKIPDTEDIYRDMFIKHITRVKILKAGNDKKLSRDMENILKNPDYEEIEEQLIGQLKMELGEKLREELERTKDLYSICKNRMILHHKLNLPDNLWKALNWKTNYFPEVRENVTACVLNE